MGMIGGSSEAFIGAVHRKAAALDGEIELVCGAFSSDPRKSRATGEALYLNPHRVYRTYAEMIEKERNLPGDQRMDFVSIVTPNHVHADPAKMALENGFHVIIDKPLAFSAAEARALQKVVEKTGLLLGLTHTYTGYPMVKEARHQIAQGKIGKVRKIYVEYHQGWLTNFIEETNKQASWRTDPARSGAGGAIGDIGTHAANLAEYMSGLSITEVNADLNIVVKGRKLDDDSALLLRFNKGATGVLTATQIAAGEENNLNIRIYGEKGAVIWRQEEPNSLLVRVYGQPNELYRAGWAYLSDAARLNTRTPWGHPEGYLEAFANIYLAFGRAVRDFKPGKKLNTARYDFPDVNDGVRGMAFIETVIRSAKSSRKWTKLKI
ncbi:MAG: Gfo/Idh/MocA family oxidoreductase [Cyclobacteriaceae bacterium]|nr:Gfo/Idh/MocA family oxidoreductase [Cyclobacteriaceae bacterium]